MTYLKCEKCGALRPEHMACRCPAPAATVRCYKHYCRGCHALFHVAASPSASASDYPSCCNRRTAFLGVVDAVPGRDESLMHSLEKRGQS